MQKYGYIFGHIDEAAGDRYSFAQQRRNIFLPKTGGFRFRSFFTFKVLTLFQISSIIKTAIRSN